MQAQSPAAGAPEESLTLAVEVPLGAEVNAGVIERAQLNAILARGIGQFLRSVITEPQNLNGRFVGWRILSLFDGQPAIHVAVLRPGDTVRRANGQSLEHPEAFKAVWDALATAKELVLDIDRNGNRSKLRYTIAN
jgi:type II secretory pathway component PulC